MSPVHQIRLPRGTLILGRRTLLMGVVNVTPDSFFRDSAHPEAEGAVEYARRLVREGADILDVGGESTRPGAVPVAAEEEWSRIAEVIRTLAASSTVPLSVDTTKAEVARKALRAGAQIVNDISGLAFDSEMAAVIRSAGAAAVLSHCRGRPESMHHLPPSANILEEVVNGLRQSVERALYAGIGQDQILVDPGIGFGKQTAENLRLINRLPDIGALGYPVLVGVSRKRFIGNILQQESPGDRIWGTAGAVACSILRGASVVRVHDVEVMRQVIAVVDAIAAENTVERSEILA